jgi:regulator of RNase E activity RraA
MSPDRKVAHTLSGVSTATITTILLKKGLRNVWMRGCRPLRPCTSRLPGPAFTLRFIPRAAIEATPEGCIALVEAMGSPMLAFMEAFSARA